MAHVFISYSHEDEDLRNKLETHLAGLKRQGAITTWHDRRIVPGDELHGRISDQLDTADIILLLVSADFIASDYCYDVEMTRALERHDHGEARVIPVILRPCDWKGAPFGGLMAVPKNGKPVVKHPTLDDGFLEVAQAIRRVAGATGARAATAQLPDSPTARADVAALGPRSSNLRVKTEFTDRDRHAYLGESYEYIARYFENSVNELQTRNYRVETDFRQVDANRFEARAFVGGEEQAICGIWLGGTFGAAGIYFSSGGLGNGNSYNESMSVSDDGYTLSLQPLGMAHLGQASDAPLTMEGAAEYFWSLFIERLR